MGSIRIYASLAGALFILFAAGASLFPQGPVAAKKAKPHELEGEWSLILEEQEGKIAGAFLPQPASPEPGVNFNQALPAFVWRFSKNEIEAWFGDEDRCRWKDKYAFALNPEQKAGTIDLVYLTRTDFYKGKPVKGTERDMNPTKRKSRAIYWIKDDWLFLCEDENVRPESFATAGKPLSRKLSVFRRGVLK